MDAAQRTRGEQRRAPVEPVDDGCVVTEFNLSFIPDSFQAMSTEISGVDDRETHNMAGMAATLERLAGVVEG